ncbi:MAG: hypothetical protein ACI9SP_004757 [Arenicella sp.]|jgi:hypothetical protein
MSDIVASVYVKCRSENELSRLMSYLNDETRPDFVDDLPDDEKELFDLIEQCPVADELTIKSENELEMFFEFDAFEVKEELPKLLAAMKCENAIYMQDSHDETLYYKLEGNHFSFLYSPIPLEDESDDEEFNRNLKNEDLVGAKSSYESGRLSLLVYLGRLA